MGLSLGSSLWVVMFLLSGGDSTQRCLSRDNDMQPFLSLTQTPTQRVESSASGLEPLYNFARVFLEAVQPNAFPEDIMSRLFFNKQQDIPQLVRYEAGYLVCLILAVLYLLLMPIVGGILAWQHSHTMKAEISAQSPSLSSRNHQDIGVTACLILVTILLLVGVILGINTNSRVRESMYPSLNHLETNARIIEDGLNSIPQNMETVMEQYSIPKAEISKAVNDADDTIGATLISSFNSNVNKALADLSASVGDAIGTIENLQTVQTKRTALQTRHTTLQRELHELQERLQVFKVDSSNLETDADYSLIPSVDDKLEGMPPASDLAGLVEQGNLSFRAIPQLCSDQVAPTVEALMLELNVTQERLMNSSRNFPSLQSLTDTVSEVRVSVRHFAGPLQHYDYVRWAVAVTLCTVILVIVILLLAALSLGLPVLFYPTIYSTYPKAVLEHTAVNLFKAAVVLSFLFSWLFIIMVFVTLFIGGNVHTLGCRSWTHGQIFKFLDQRMDLFMSLNITNGSETNQTPSTSAIYRGCETGQSLFYSMDINQRFDLEDFLNASKYMEGFQRTAQNLSVNLNDLKLLPDQGRQGLLNFRGSGIDSIDYDMFFLLLSRPVVKRDLAAFADELDEKAKLPANEEIKEDLKAEAANVRHLDDIAKQQTLDAGIMNTSVTALRDISKTYKDNVNTTLDSFDQTEVALRKQVPLIAGNVTQCTLEKGEQCLLRYLDWVRHTILNDVLGCHWLAVSLDNVYTAVCLNVIDPWNAFWLCLGWCCVFLVPAVIFGIYIARRLKPMPTTIFFGKDNFTLPEKNPEKNKSNYP